MMVEAMVGREVREESIVREKSVDYTKDPLLNIKNLQSTDGKVNGIDMDVYPGEIVGIAGLMGSGRTELLKCVYGLMTPKSGRVILREKDVTWKKTMEISSWRRIYDSEDRRKAGIVDIHSVK